MLAKAVNFLLFYLKSLALLTKNLNYLQRLIFCIFVLSFGFVFGQTDVQTKLNDDEIFSYEMKLGVTGTIRTVGSDSLARLVAAWADGYKQHYPHVNFEIKASGSSTAVQSLLQGTANIGPMSRPLNSIERSKFVSVFGYEPTVFTVAIDALALYVDATNTIDSLNHKQIDAIFSATRFCGGTQKISSFSQLSDYVNNNQTIELYGRTSGSGTYDMFRQLALCNGDYLQTVNQMQSSSSAAASVIRNHNAIAYASLSARNEFIKVLGISHNDSRAIYPNEQTLQSGAYPFKRFLYLVVNKKPKQGLSALESSFLSYVLSSEGQRAVVPLGYFPLGKQQLLEQLESLN